MIEVLPALGRFADVDAVLRPRSNPERACWCLTYRLSPVELTQAPSRPDAMRALCGTAPGPGLVALVDGESAGWCGVGPRRAFHRLNGSRTIQAVDDQPVWSVVCLVVKAGYRGKGVAAAMLDAAVEFAREHGAPIVEGYPVDGRVDGAFAFPGSVPLFERAGFARIAPTGSKSGGATRWIMRRELD